MRLLIGIYILFALALPGLVAIRLARDILLSVREGGSPTQYLDFETVEILGIALLFSFIPAFTAVGLWRRLPMVRLFLLVISWFLFVPNAILAGMALASLASEEWAKRLGLHGDFWPAFLTGAGVASFGLFQFLVLVRPAVREQFEGRHRRAEQPLQPSAEDRTPIPISHGIVEQVALPPFAKDLAMPDAPRDRAIRLPRFPTLVRVAGILWIVFGVLFLANALFNIAALGAQEDGRPNPGMGFAGCCGFLFCAAFFVVGMQTVLGTARDTLGNGIGSIVIGLFQFLFGAFIVVAGLVAGGRPDVDPDEAVLAIVAGGTSFGTGLGLIAAGILALVGRQDYLAWRRARKKQAASR